MSGTLLQQIEVTILLVLVIGYALLGLAILLGRTRPGLNLAYPIIAAFGVRLLVALGVAASPFGRELFGPDELDFLAAAEQLSAGTSGSGAWLDALVTELQVWIFAVQMDVFDAPEASLRVTQIGISVAGLTLLATAVYELAGPRPAAIAAWILALEPTNVFFSGLLHDEPNMFFATGLVAFAGAAMWNRPYLRLLIPMSAGWAVAVATRNYAGWFLIAAGAVTVLHASLRTGVRWTVSSVALIGVVSALGIVAIPLAVESSSELTSQLQRSQDALTQPADDNLALDPVDFSAPDKIVINLPRRVFDLLFRPYPWELGSLSQRLGLLGTLVVVALIAVLAKSSWQNRGRVLARAGPLIYVMTTLAIAYGLTAANAGGAFRHRSQIVAVALCAVIVLRGRRSHVAARYDKGRAHASRSPVAEVG